MLAGQNLKFHVEIVAIREATEEELAHGHVHGEDEGHECCGGHGHGEEGGCCGGGHDHDHGEEGGCCGGGHGKGGHGHGHGGCGCQN